MERPKAAPGKKGKGRVQAAPPGELIALGKSSTQDKPDLKRAASPQPIGRKLVASAGKRDATTALGASSCLLAKKPKVGAQTFTPLGRPAIEAAERRGSPAPSFSSLSQPQLMAFEEAAIDVDPSDLVSRAQAASKEGDEEQVEGLICGAVRYLRNNRCKPDYVASMSLILLAKEQPSFFLSDIITEAFCSVLKRDIGFNFKAKGNPSVSVLACNVLMAAFVNEENWPDNFVKVYIDDLLGERVWVDREDCKPFVDNIVTAFPTQYPPKQLMVNIDSTTNTVTTTFASVGAGSPMRTLMEEDEASKSSDGGDSDKTSSGSSAATDFPVLPRYPCQQTNIQAYVIEVVKDYVAKRQAMDVSSRALIRLMAVTAGYSEIRTMAAQRLEMWLQNPKLQKTAQDLLLCVCCNCNVDSRSDQEVVLQLLKMRIKIKQNVSHYLMCVRQLLLQHSDNVALVVKTTLINELSSARNHNNMSLLNLCFSLEPLTSSKVLAEVFQELLASKDDYLRSLRGLLRETVRNTRQDINFVTFCQGLTTERMEPKFTEMEPTMKERYVNGIVDLIPLSMLLSITPAVREATSRSDPKEREALYKFRNQLAIIERDAVFWLHSVVPKIIDVNAKPKEYIHCLRKVLFMELPEFYYSKDNWPPDIDRPFMLRLVVEAPVLEDTLLRVILIGLARDLPAQSHDCIDIVDSKVRRAAGLHLDSMQVLQMGSLEIFNALMNISTYRHPENILLPVGYTPPKLAITSTYWKSWTVLLILAAFNPTTIGKEAWDNYPTLKCLMEMMMTNNYTFPPPTFATNEKSVEDVRAAERQVYQQEIPKILEFESHLAGTTITQQNSLLLQQVMSLDPHGIPRTPPQPVLESYSELNTNYKIGHLLCRSRQPDFLLEVIERQGPTKSMSWLAELVETSEGSLSMLPVHCLCEFLLHEPSPLSAIDLNHDDDVSKKEKHRYEMRTRKHGQLLSQLQELVHSSPDDTTTMFDVLNYFLQRLASGQTATRQQAVKGLTMVITQPNGVPEEEPMEVDGQGKNTDWLLRYMPILPMFPMVKEQLCQSLRQACQVESDPKLVSGYIIFLSQHGMDSTLQVMDDLVVDVSQLIVERNSVMAEILPDSDHEKGEDYHYSLYAFLSIFHSYLASARRLQKGEYSWSNTQDQILLQWKTGETATMHILVVHAIIIILSYGRPLSEAGEAMYNELLDIWFPTKDSMPKAFLLDTSEEALLLPDWLKLRMIRSAEYRLVEAALHELDPRQLLLFVQSFGIPVTSMTHLLSSLDSATEADPVGLLQLVRAMNDPTYISRLIQIQRMRGAMEGDKFYGLVTEGDTIPEAFEREREMGEEFDEVPELDLLPLPPPPPPRAIATASEMTSDFFKMLEAETTTPDVMESMEESLKDLVSADDATAATFLQSIAQRVEGSEGTCVVQQMMKKSVRTSSIMKTFIDKHPSLHASLAAMLQTIMDKVKVDDPSTYSCSLFVMSRMFLKSRQDKKPVSIKRQASIDLDNLRTHGTISASAFIQGVGKLEDFRLEAFIQLFMQECLQKQSTSSESVKLACTLMQQSAGKGKSSEACESLLTDWLELLDPEIMKADLDFEEMVVFGKRVKVKLEGGMADEVTPGQQRMVYLRALLAHHSSWDTIRQCLRRILSPRKLTIMDPTSVLDFVWALRHSPKIWQGREHKTTKDANIEDIFQFTREQLLVITDFILLESDQTYKPSSSGITTKTEPNVIRREPDNRTDLETENGHCCTDYGADVSSMGEEKEQKTEVSSRLDLLLACLCEREDRVRAVAAHLQNREDSVSCTKLLTEIYLHFPYILSWMPPLGPESMTSDKKNSRMDTVTHRLIGVLGDAGPGKQLENRMKDANMVCRKLAAQHPTLILRQLPLLAAVVGGHSQMTLGEMRHRQLLTLFDNVMGIMEILQPLIFHQQHTALQPLLHAFFALFKTHGKERREVSTLLSKMVLFLQNFVTCDPQYASSTLQQYVTLLSQLSTIYTDKPELKSLLTGLSLPRQTQEDDLMTSELMDTEEEPEDAAGVVPLQSQSSGEAASPNTQMLEVMVQTLQDEDSPLEELVEVLEELDDTSQRKVTILENFGTELRELMTHYNEYCRNTAFVLIMRHIHHNPEKASEFVSSYLNCLQHYDPDIVMSALKNLSEFTVLCQDDASILLRKAFEVGVRTNVDTTAYISNTLQLLNMESILDAKQPIILP